jgi:hypothetical protein
MRRLPRLRRLQRVPRLQGLQLRRLRGRSLLHIVGRLPHLLSAAPEGQHDWQTTIQMAGSDKVDPAIPCLFSPQSLLSVAACGSSARKQVCDGLQGFQPFQTMLARERDIQISCMFLRTSACRAGASE